jgi:DNA-binding transcriptional ArsR family regulator
MQRYHAIMSSGSERSVAQLDSARLRTLAHPARARLLGLLRLEGPATATALAKRLGTNSGQTSYHLRQLAEVGLVIEDTERGNRRERWWRAAHEATTWSSVDFRDDPDDRAAEDWLAGYAARMHARWAQDWLDTRGEWSDAWVHASTLSDLHLRLTSERAKAMSDEIHAVIERYREHEDEEGAEPVTVTFHAFPHPEPSL